MAKNYDFDMEDNDPFNLDDEFGEKKIDPADRSVVVDATSGLVKGAVTGVVDPTYIKKSLKTALPSDFNSTYDFVGKSTGSISTIYNDSLKTIKPGIKEFKKTIPKLIPKDSKILPKSVSDMLGRWEQETKGTKSGPSEEEIRDSLMSQQIADIFQVQSIQMQETRSEDIATDRLKEGIELTRHKDIINSSTSTNISLSNIDKYINSVDLGYKKKSLELQFRTLFSIQDSIKVNTELSENSSKLLLDIIKNTSLPEYLKIKDSEVLKQMSFNKFAEASMGGLYSARDDMVKTFTTNISNKVKETLVNTKDNMSNMLDTLTMVKEARDEIGSDKSITSEIAGTVGSMVSTDYVDAKIYSNKDKAIKYLKDNMGIDLINYAKKANHFQKHMNNNLIDFSKTKEEDTTEGEYISNALIHGKNFARDMLKPKKEDIQLDVDNSNLLSPVSFIKRTEVSIAEVIPGYLARILRETTSIRSGKPTDLIHFDFDSGKFIGETKFKEILDKKLINSNQTLELDEKLSELINTFKPKEDLSTEQTLNNEEYKLLKKALYIKIQEGGRLDKKSVNKILKNEKKMGSKLTESSIEKITANIDVSSRVGDKHIDSDNNILNISNQAKSMMPDIREVQQNLYNQGGLAREYSGNKFNKLDEDKIDTNIIDVNKIRDETLDVEKATSRQSKQEKIDHQKRIKFNTDKEDLIKSISLLLKETKKTENGNSELVYSDSIEGNRKLLTELENLDKTYSHLAEAGIKASDIIDKGTLGKGLFGAKRKRDTDSIFRKMRSITVTSDEDTKDNKKNLKGSILDSFRKMDPIKEWKYKEKNQKENGEPKGKFIGPMAQDIQKNFGDYAAPDGKKINLTTLNGINMASTKELVKEVDTIKSNISNINNKSNINNISNIDNKLVDIFNKKIDTLNSSLDTTVNGVNNLLLDSVNSVSKKMNLPKVDINNITNSIKNKVSNITKDISDKGGIVKSLDMSINNVINSVNPTNVVDKVKDLTISDVKKGWTKGVKIYKETKDETKQTYNTSKEEVNKVVKDFKYLLTTNNINLNEGDAVTDTMLEYLTRMEVEQNGNSDKVKDLPYIERVKLIIKASTESKTGHTVKGKKITEGIYDVLTGRKQHPDGKIINSNIKPFLSPHNLGAKSISKSIKQDTKIITNEVKDIFTVDKNILNKEKTIPIKIQIANLTKEYSNVLTPEREKEFKDKLNQILTTAAKNKVNIAKEYSTIVNNKIYNKILTKEQQDKMSSTFKEYGTKAEDIIGKENIDLGKKVVLDIKTKTKDNINSIKDKVLSNDNVISKKLNIKYGDKTNSELKFKYLDPKSKITTDKFVDDIHKEHLSDEYVTSIDKTLLEKYGISNKKHSSKNIKNIIKSFEDYKFTSDDNDNSNKVRDFNYINKLLNTKLSHKVENDLSKGSDLKTFKRDVDRSENLRESEINKVTELKIKSLKVKYKSLNTDKIQLLFTKYAMSKKVRDPESILQLYNWWIKQDKQVEVLNKNNTFKATVIDSVLTKANSVKSVVNDYKKGYLTDVDLYMPLYTNPHIRYNKLIEGKYRDKESNKVLKNLADIKGTVIDEFDKVVVTSEDVSKLMYYDKNLKKNVPFNKLSNIKKDVSTDLNGGYRPIANLLKAGLYTMFDDNNDIYVKGDTTPRLLMIKLKNGHYRYLETGKVLTDPSKINGPIIDENNNILITNEDIPNLIVYEPKYKTYKPLKTIYGLGKSLTNGLINWQFKIAPKLVVWNFKQIWNGTKLLKRVLFDDSIKDVYLIGKDGKIGKEPVLYATRIKAGDYYSVNSDKVLSNHLKIDGPIADGDGNILISKEDLGNLRVYNSFFQLINPFKYLGILFRVSTKIISSTLKGAWKLSKVFTRGITSVISKSISGVAKYLTKPIDVYLVDSKIGMPRLEATKMDGTHYFDKDGNGIKHQNDIKGPVFDIKGNLLISEEDIKNGLLRPDGTKLNNNALSKIGKGIGTFLSFLNKKTSYSSKLLSGKKIISKETIQKKKEEDILKEKNKNNPITKPSSLSVKLVEKIFNVSDKEKVEEVQETESTKKKKEIIKKRLAEGKTIIPEKGTKKDNNLSKISKLENDINKNPTIKTLLESNDIAEEQVDIGKKTLSLIGNIKDYLDNKNKKNKIFGDTDGDGDSENKVDDILNKRKSLKDKLLDNTLKNKDNVKSTDEDKKSSGLYSTILASLGIVGDFISKKILSIGTEISTKTTGMLVGLKNTLISSIKGIISPIISTIKNILSVSSIKSILSLNKPKVSKSLPNVPDKNIIKPSTVVPSILNDNKKISIKDKISNLTNPLLEKSKDKLNKIPGISTLNKVVKNTTGNIINTSGKIGSAISSTTSKLVNIGGKLIPSNTILKIGNKTIPAFKLVSKLGLKAASLPAAILGMGAEYGGEKLIENGYKKSGAALNIAGTATSWAGTGALLGSIVPGIGTAIGAGVGGLAGGAYGLYNQWDNITGNNDLTDPNEVKDSLSSYITNAGRSILNASKKIVNKLPNLSDISNSGNSLLDSFSNFNSNLLNAGKKIISSLPGIGLITSAGKLLVNSFSNVGDLLLNAGKVIVNKISTIGTDLLSSSKQLYNNFTGNSEPVNPSTITPTNNKNVTYKKEPSFTDTVKGNISKTWDYLSGTNSADKIKKENTKGNILTPDKYGEDGDEPNVDKNSNKEVPVGIINKASGNLFKGSNGINYLKMNKISDGTVATITGMNPAFNNNLLGMAEEYGNITNKKINVTSGYRTYEQQDYQFKNSPPGKAAKAGNSMHEKGLGIDISSTDADSLDKLGLMRKYGFTRPIGEEPWHIEPIGLQMHYDKAKTNPKLAEQMIQSGIGKGGGGIGALGRKSGLRGRNLKNSLAIMAMGNNVVNNKVISKIPENKTIPKVITTPNYSSVTKSTVVPILSNTELKTPIIENDSIESKSKVTETKEVTRLPFNNLNSLQKPDPLSSIPNPKSSGYDGVKDTIIGAANKVGIDPNLALKVAAVESDFVINSGIDNPVNKGARGLFQFTNGTWKDMMKNHGASKHKLNPDISIFDPKAQSILGAEYLKQGIKRIPNASVSDIYAHHFLGPAGVNRFKKALNADPNTPANLAVDSDSINSNPNIFYNYKGKEKIGIRTVGEVQADLERRISKKTDFYKLPNSIHDKNTISTYSTNSPITNKVINNNNSNSYVDNNKVDNTYNDLKENKKIISKEASKAIKVSSETPNINNTNYTDINNTPSNQYNSINLNDTNNILKESLSTQKEILETLKGLINSNSTKVIDTTNTINDKRNEFQSTPYLSPKPKVSVSRKM